MKSSNREVKGAVANNKLLILSLSGIGNYLMHTPFIEQVKKQRPLWHLTLWCAPRGQAALARVNPAISEVIEAPLQSPFLKDTSLILKLRRRRFAAAVMLSPGQRFKGAAYLAVAGIPRRIGHQYPLNRNRNSDLLLTDAISEQPGLHDIEQNLNLLPLLSLNYSLSAAHYSLYIPPLHHAQATQLLSNLNIPKDKILIGLHAGSTPHASFKRWPLDRFTELAKVLIEKHNAFILIFGGSQEENLKHRIYSLLTANHSLSPNLCSIISADLLTTAAVIQNCKLFISNDSGLMHLAAAAGAPTLGLFGPTDESEIGPHASATHGSRHDHVQPVVALRAPGTFPVYSAEQNWQLGNQPHSTMQQLPLNLVLSTAITLLAPRA